MANTGSLTPVQVVPVFVESQTSYRGWIGSVQWHLRGKLLFPGGRAYLGPFTTFVVVRRPDGLSSQLRSALVKASPYPPVYAHVLIQTPSLDFVKLNNVDLVSVGSAVWTDPTHSKPDMKLESVTYQCAGIDVNGKGVSPATYNWWPLNSAA
jgi:hypothetical protein